MTSVPVLAPVHALFVAGALMLSAPAAFAETTPRPGPHDNRVRIATWTEGQVYRVVTTPTRVTTVEFGEGETIRSIIAGDTVGFQFDGVPVDAAFLRQGKLRFDKIPEPGSRGGVVHISGGKSLREIVYLRDSPFDMKGDSGKDVFPGTTEKILHGGF